ncbi:hypothetical protein AKJ41_04165 [candidate division MSBL1 archaeon SCGC-AAA259O05]|uniref:Tyr recombinase domain-containing protein n=1 Tax=candidate division MSBL1 archaeon SCGC-AAA259O05 TaxID=1698271 RepID=A0A133V1Q8_9EURY|nr:hypothetical protein AKJ41_04165 [candidate division MSBL1 archaeon SCGC-AAA259O05]
MCERKERNPFGHGDPHDPPSLREFEVDLGIKSREGEGAWESDLPSVQNLLDHLQRYSGSEGTKDEYLRIIHRFYKFSEKDLGELVEAEKEDVESLVQEFGDEIARDGGSKRYVNSVMRTLRTFLEVNGHENLQLETHHVPSRYSKRTQYVPRKEEIHRMARITESLRDRAIILFLWTTGLRVSTAVGLNYGDIKEEFESDEKFVKVPVYPEMKKRVPDACKGEIPYYTFVHPLATRHLRIYLSRRETKYGPMREDYPLFHSDWRHWEKDERTKRRLRRRSVQRTVKKSAKLAGIDEWENVTPHCLRKAFKSVLRAPTKKGGRLDEGTQEFFMGHILPGTQDEYYDRSNVEFHRQEYAKLDFSDDRSSGQNEGRKEEKAGGPDKVVEKEELPEHLGRGWIFLEKIDDEQFIIRRAEATDGVKT